MIITAGAEAGVASPIITATIKTYYAPANPWHAQSNCATMSAMFQDIDLRQLTELTAPDRAFLSVYLASPQSATSLDKRFEKMRKAVEADERDYFDENVKSVQTYLERHPLKSGSQCLLSCWALDFFQAIPLPAAVPDLVWIDSSPYVRPLAQLQEEYENVAVVVADNKKARIFCISAAVAGDEKVVTGNIKNHVRKGGWSQQRYERRRDKQLLHYAREIVEALAELDKEENFRRIILVGGKEALQAVYEDLPVALQTKVAQKAIDLHKPKDEINEEIQALFTEQERQSERELWDKIRSEHLRGGLGVAGLTDVLAAAELGRIDTMIVNRTFHPEGRRCRDCENLDATVVETCSACGSSSVYEVDVVNEIVERLKQTGAETDFADPIDTLTAAGEIAALLRY